MSDFTFSGSTLTGYTGEGGAITLPSVNGPTTITTISASAFTANTVITSVTIPSSYTSIENGAGFDDIYGAGAFSECTSLTTVNASASNITLFGDCAFNNCPNLTTVLMPNTVTAIGVAVFNNCKQLTNVTFPTSLQTINSYAFADCWTITSLVFNSGLVSIGVWAFSHCQNLESISFNASLQFIDYYAFLNCPKLTTVYVPVGTTYNTGAGETFDVGVTVISGSPPGGVACFTSGTMILTPGGEVAVETLKAGDLVTTASGLVTPLKRVLTTRVASTTKKTAPYHIPARTYGSAQPRDLVLSPNHAFQMRRGVWMAPVEAAETKPAVHQISVGEPVTYYHLECPVYLRDNLVANGCIVESLGSFQAKKHPYHFSKRLGGYVRDSVTSSVTSITHVAH